MISGGGGVRWWGILQARSMEGLFVVPFQVLLFFLFLCSDGYDLLRVFSYCRQ